VRHLTIFEGGVGGFMNKHERAGRHSGARVDRLRAMTAVVLVGTLAACSNSSATAPSNNLTTASALSSSSPVTSASPVTPTSSAASSSSTAPATTANPWPADLTPDQQAMAQAALATYHQAWMVTDEAYADPTKDWEPAIRKYIADPRARQVLKAIASLAADQQHTTGSSQVTAWVTAVEGSGDGAKVTIDACVDSSGADLLDVNGHSVKAPLPAGPRIKQSGNVYKYADKDGGWLLSEASISTPYEPC